MHGPFKTFSIFFSHNFLKDTFTFGTEFESKSTGYSLINTDIKYFPNIGFPALCQSCTNRCCHSIANISNEKLLILKYWHFMVNISNIKSINLK